MTMAERYTVLILVLLIRDIALQLDKWDEQLAYIYDGMHSTYQYPYQP